GQDLAQARTLREAIYQTINRHLTGQPPGPGHLAIINTWARRPPPRTWLETDDGQLRARRDAATAAAPVASVARDAADPLASPRPRRRARRRPRPPPRPSAPRSPPPRLPPPLPRPHPARPPPLVLHGHLRRPHQDDHLPRPQPQHRTRTGHDPLRCGLKRSA